MRNPALASFACVLLAGVAPSQHLPVAAVGIHDVAWANTSGFGTPVLAARVYYPAVMAGFDAPPQTCSGGWPTIVFLHGYSFLGSDYPVIADTLTNAGYVAVMLDTAQYSYVDLTDDARAIFAATLAANQDGNSLLFGMVDVDRIGLLGHSMGGAVAGYALYDNPNYPEHNPGYRCGLALAPVDPGAAAAGSVVVPFGIVAGEGDAVTPVAQHALPYYQALAPEQGIKFCYLMDSACGHMNVAGLDPAAPAVFARSLRIVTGFFGQFLGNDMQGLEPVLGPDGLGESHLSVVHRQVVTPQIWSEVDLQLGAVVRVSLIAESGLCGVLAASDLVPVPLPTLIGDLLLDPTSAFPVTQTVLHGDRLDLWIAVPDQETFVGSAFALQGVGATVASPFRLGSALRLTVAR